MILPVRSLDPTDDTLCFLPRTKSNRVVVPFTDLSRSVVPKLRSVVPELRSVVPKLRSVAPKLRSVVPKLRFVVPKLRSVAPKLRSVVPKLRFVVPKLRSVAPKLRFVVLCGSAKYLRRPQRDSSARWRGCYRLFDSLHY